MLGSRSRERRLSPRDHVSSYIIVYGEDMSTLDISSQFPLELEEKKMPKKVPEAKLKRIASFIFLLPPSNAR
jgi:hypothetical protein